MPSDHQGVMMNPHHVSNVPLMRQKIIRTIRPITSSPINNLGQFLTEEQWEFMDTDLNPTDLTELFQSYTVYDTLGMRGSLNFHASQGFNFQ